MTLPEIDEFLPTSGRWTTVIAIRAMQDYARAAIAAAQQAEPDEALRKDAERYRWLAARLLAADFDYNGEGVQALVFELPHGCAVSANCNATIDAAMVRP